ncbi:MAG: ROK family protein [Hespellia sp.]|nr:ROK family protein [Hespellia sp.]
MKYYVGVDIGGTSIKYGIINEEAEIVTQGEMPTEAMQKGGSGIMEKAESIVSDYQKSYVLEGICISTAGMVDYKQGEIFYAAPLIPDYTGTRIKERMETKFQIPCEVENDVNCAGLAESISGAGQPYGICLCLTVGTGIGGCIVVNQQVYHGFSNSACEVGYMKFGDEEFQSLGSSKTLVRKIEEEKGLEPGSFNGKMVFEKAVEGDEVCIHRIDEMADILGKGIANICYVINPEAVILGGGIMAQKEYLQHRIREAMDRYLVPSIAQKTTLLFAKHKNDAGMLGAFYHYQNQRKKE